MLPGTVVSRQQQKGGRRARLLRRLASTESAVYMDQRSHAWPASGRRMEEKERPGKISASLDRGSSEHGGAKGRQ